MAGDEVLLALLGHIYAASHRFIALLPRLMDRNGADQELVTLNLGSVDVAHESAVSIKPERLVGRHCAILGATGGGKSWTTARIIEECIKYNAKLILIDATGEYRGFAGEGIKHCHLGDPVEKAEDSISCLLPPTSFSESDFVAMFEPSEKVQGPKLRAAIQSLRLAALETSIADHGDPKQQFDVHLLSQQIVNECVQDYGDPRWKGPNEAEVGYCASLLTRINGILTSQTLHCVFVLMTSRH